MMPKERVYGYLMAVEIDTAFDYPSEYGLGHIDGMRESLEYDTVPELLELLKAVENSDRNSENKEGYIVV